MNAVTPFLTPLALQNAALLARLASGEPFQTLADLAREVCIDRSNLNRKLEALEGERLIRRDTSSDRGDTPASDALQLTEAGLAAHHAIGRANHPADWAADVLKLAGAVPPEGFDYLTAAQIAFDAGNARTHSGLSALEIEEMAASIREHGLLTPPIVRRVEQGPGDPPDYFLVAGERRLRGWQLAIERGWLPEDTIFLCQIFDGDDVEASEAALVENILRVDLDNLEVAEGLLKLSRKSEPPATAPQLAKRLGKTGESGERWVQERLRVAQEASAADKQRYRDWQARKAAAGEAYRDDADPDVFRWTDLRNSVKKAKHLTALEKNPRLALLVVELALISEDGLGYWDAPVAINAPPPGGVADQAEQLGLVTWDRHGPPITLTLTQLATDWLTSEGFGEDLDSAAKTHARVRALALGEMGALAVPPGQWATSFLNLPRGAPGLDAEPQPSPDTQASPTLRPGLTGDAFSRQIRALREEAGDAEAGPPAGALTPGPASNAPPAGALPPDGRQAAEAADEAAQTDPGDTPPPGSNPDPLADLSPLARLALLELALATRTQGIEARQGGLRGPRLYDFHLDPSGTWAELYAGKWAHPGQGPGGWLAVMTQKALDALAVAYPAGITADDLDAEMTAAGITTIEDDWFAPWLNPPAPAAPEPRSAPPAPNPSPAPSGEGGARSATDEGSAGGGQVGDVIVGGMRRALVQLHAQATTAQALLRDIEGHEAREGQVLSADLWPRLTGVLAGLSVGLQDAAPYLPKEQG